MVAGNIPPQFANIQAICQEAHWQPRTLADHLNEAIERMRKGLAINPHAEQLLEIFNYVKDSQIIVPVYDNIHKTIASISKPFLGKIVTTYGDFVQNMNQNLSDTQLVNFSCTREDIANEVWHLVFGEVNEQLVKRAIVKEPMFYEGQGRYLKCLEFNH
ncbi:hypothetical protein IMX26_15020 [Clostridium sp. 'deep sea']|uniref:hypothetical protein n=1 Tax=Clostridium sp. 'deep sea' TaxID=2779445 RepID=UPI0018967C31|nr:hypothetical protein [Clostridium sp. 'deep sea']QOR34754.1 hypothetical protein IMX26_15020 [Clostridium sp. 'deep sea']